MGLGASKQGGKESAALRVCACLKAVSPPAKRPAAAPHGALTRRFAALRRNRRDGGALVRGQEGWRSGEPDVGRTLAWCFGVMLAGREPDAGLVKISRRRKKLRHLGLQQFDQCRVHERIVVGNVQANNPCAAQVSPSCAGLAAPSIHSAPRHAPSRPDDFCAVPQSGASAHHEERRRGACLGADSGDQGAAVDGHNEAIEKVNTSINF